MKYAHHGSSLEVALAKYWMKGV